MIPYLLNNLILLLLLFPLLGIFIIATHSPENSKYNLLKVRLFLLLGFIFLLLYSYIENEAFRMPILFFPFIVLNQSAYLSSLEDWKNSDQFIKDFISLTLEKSTPTPNSPNTPNLLNTANFSNSPNGGKKKDQDITRQEYKGNLLFRHGHNEWNAYIKLDENREDNLRKLALIFTLITFFINTVIWFRFNANYIGVQFISPFSFMEGVELPSFFSLANLNTETNYIFPLTAFTVGIEEGNTLYSWLSGTRINVGIDGNSLYFTLLTTFITPICLLSNWKEFGLNNLKTFLISFLLLETLQLALFVVLDLLLFYIFFESVLIPLFIIILLFGASKEKVRASYLLFLYTLFGSLFMLLSILVISYHVGSTDLQLIWLYDITLDSQMWLWIGFFIAFAIKTPIWPLNTWLIKAHVEAPLAGSILLAGTILKLATYGYLRILLPILPDATHWFLPYVQAIAIISLIYASFATIIQEDTKAVIAYSSVAHMAVVILGIFSNSIQGIEGSILLSLAHGFVSPALFVCCGGIVYSRTHSRVITYLRGLTNYMPIFTILFFLFTLFNTGVPLSLNFTGEIMSLMGSWFRSPMVAVLGASGIVLSACFSIWLYNRISYGSFSPYFYLPIPSEKNDYPQGKISIVPKNSLRVRLKDINKREFILLVTLLIPTVMLGIYPNCVLNGLHSTVSYLIYT